MRKKEIPESVKIFGKNIQNIIAEKKMKARIVAHDADIDVEVLRRYMGGKQIMGIDKAILIAKALDVDVAELFKSI